MLTFVEVGTCTINADQAGNGSYLAATQVSRSFTVNAVVPSAPTIGTATAGNAQASVAFTAPANNGGAAITLYTVTSSPGGLTGTGAGSPITVSGLTNGTAYTFTVRATNGAGAGTPSSASNEVTPKASQSISFTNPGDQIVGTTVSLSASTSSGLSVSFSSSTPTICTVTGNQVTLVAVGTCTLSADSAGSAAYEAASSSQSFTVKAEPNKVPVITQGSSFSVTVNEDAKVAFSLSATDANNEPLSWTIKTQPQQGSAEVGITGGTLYTPVANYEGADSFVVAVSDGKDTATTTVSVTVVPVNDAPSIAGAAVSSIKIDEAYSFVPVASDIDKDAVLTFSITNKPSWLSFNTATGVLTGTPAAADLGTAKDIVISVSDGTESASLAAFNIKVIAADPAAPILTVPADISVKATGLYTPVSVRQLLGLPESTSQADLDKALLALSVNGKGESCCTSSPEGLSGDKLLLKPGKNSVKWTAKSAAGLSASDIQIVKVSPMVSLSQSQIAVRGTSTEFRVLLNGVAPDYPFIVAYELDAATTATPAEHSLTNGSVTLTDGQLEAVVPVVLMPVANKGDSQLIVRLAGAVNSGANRSHTVSLRNGNMPPVISIAISQGGLNTSLVTPNGGPVSVSVTVADPNKLDTHTFDWSATQGLADTDGNPVNASRSFDPAGLTGSHQVQVTVTDSAGAVVQAQAYFRVIANLPVLDDIKDTDLDGIGDKLEGTGDFDDNGIPDYLDNMPSSNILPQHGNSTNAYLIECDPGVRCGLGLFARGGTSGGVQILNSELGKLDNLIVDPAFEPVGGIFDFTISDLPIPGQSVRVVIPQQSAIPANAVYRKFQKGKWVTFVSDTDNALHSAVGSAGYCPPPGAAEWMPGLTAGHLCVQLTLEDGGPNDSDGLVNSAVVDPGVVSSAKAVEPPPVVPPVEPPTTAGKKKGGSVDLLLCLLLLAGLLLTRVRTR